MNKLVAIYVIFAGLYIVTVQMQEVYHENSNESNDDSLASLINLYERLGYPIIKRGGGNNTYQLNIRFDSNKKIKQQSNFDFGMCKKVCFRIAKFENFWACCKSLYKLSNQQNK